jgi:hypothetical protein
MNHTCIVHSFRLKLAYLEQAGVIIRCSQGAAASVHSIIRVSKYPLQCLDWVADWVASLVHELQDLAGQLWRQLLQCLEEGWLSGLPAGDDAGRQQHMHLMQTTGRALHW